ncbi:acyltransferase family protein [Vibrio hangzhouensis]|uniref:acyltransferase family protein n=1 Tax=Vibrio hangzhouensis TaxID=462991 RepID=UPI001C93E98A|nr:acyltransferase family protein [Vibrio hangzhouensis]MBY6198478.1 acyltransferase family protein [Vibrio hangzhouensis]
MISTRNNKIDVLRGVALICIFIAHVNPPSVVFQLRNFDVVLMVFISGVCFSFNFIGGKVENYIQSIIKRIKRIVYPVWLFLTLFFIVQFALMNTYSLKEVLLSYSLISGIGFVWIFRVFICVSILLPLFIVIENKSWFGLGVAILIVNLMPLSNKIYDVFIIQSVNYTLIAFLGYKLKQLKLSNYQRLFCFLLVCIVLLSFFYLGVDIQNYKYPPQLLYLLYGILMSIFLYSLKISGNRYIEFLGRNSMWLYLWHIPAIQMADGLSLDFLSSFAFVLFFSVVICKIQIFLVNKFIANKRVSIFLLG